MRTCVLFLLALGGLALLADDASAFGRKNRRSKGCNSAPSSCCGSSGVTRGYARTAGCSTCGGVAYAGMSGGSSTITTIDGKTYVRGADGKYYAGMTAGMRSGDYFTPGTMYYSGYYGNYPGVYQAGYASPGNYYGNGIRPAGAQTMPGATQPGSTVPKPLPNK